MNIDNKNEKETTNISFKVEKIDIPYAEGDKASDAFGSATNDDSFKFVQQDKKIHDVKFTTRPTTFFKDALRRFRKNKSSVVAAVILGTLILLALIIPFEINGVGTISYDIKSTHNYETNLPMKLFPAGTGFWDGTITAKNQALPYSLNDDGSINYDDYIGDYTDENSIIDIKDVEPTYSDRATASGSGGYAKIEKFAHGDNGVQVGYLYFSPMSFDLDTNEYSITYTLGTREQDDYVTPNYAILLYSPSGTTTYNLLTDYTDNYGEEVENEDDGQTVTQHESVTVSLNELIEAKNLDSSITNSQFAIGFIIQSDENYSTAFYLHDFTITGKVKSTGNSLPASQRSELRARSFGSSDARMADANTMVLQDQKTSSSQNNTSYWTSATDVRFDCADCYSITCTLVIDQYLVTYGYRSGISISESQMRDWAGKGYINYNFEANNIEAPSSFEVTEEGEASGEVYVRSVESQSGTIGTLTFSCTVLMYKYLGYSKMPIHIFGTEAKGKDLLKYVFSGLRTSLILGFIVAFINILIGVVWGSISGYFGGAVDLTMERITDILSGMPWIVLMTILSIKLGQNFFTFALALCLTGWIGTASMTRSQFYRYRGREYVLAAKTLGANAPRLIFRHILPNAIGPIITSSVLMIPSTIFSEATISYLGLGLQNLDSLGVILSDTQKNLSTYPYQLVIPAVIISLLMICFNLFGNGLRDAFNPSLKGSD